MAVNPSYSLSVSILDQSNEIGRTSINVADAIALTTPLPSVVGAFLSGFLGFLSVGTDVALNATTSRKVANAATGTGNREDRWLVRYQDNVTLAVYTFQVPCRDNSLTLVPNTNILNPTNTGYAAAKTALEAIAVSPDANPITLLDIQLI